MSDFELQESGSEFDSDDNSDAEVRKSDKNTDQQKLRTN